MRGRDLLPLLLAVLLVALFFWPVWLLGYRFPLGGGDLQGQLLPVWDYVARWVRHGRFPLWDTQLMAGDPVIAEAQYGLLNPLNWPLFLFSPIPQRLLLVRVMVSLGIAAVGMALYLRRAPRWRLGWPAALTGALAYTLSQPFVIHLGHPHILDVMAWLPWVLWGMEAAMRRSRAIPWAAAAVGMLLLGGHGQAILYALLFAAGYALVLGGAGATSWRRWARMGLAAAAGAALAMPVLLPALERMPRTMRAIVPPEARHGYEFRPAMWIDFLTPNFHGQGWRFWPGWERVESGYVGAVALALAAAGLWWGLRTPRHRRAVRFLLAALVVALLFAPGWQGPIYPRLASLPFFEATWKTGRVMGIVAFILAVLAALGVEGLSRGGVERRGWAVGVALVGAALLVAAPRMGAAAPAGAPRAMAVASLRFAALLLLGAAPLGLLTGPFPRRAATALLLLLAAELIAVGATAEVEPIPPSLRHDGALAFLRADPGWFRVDIDLAALNRWTVPELLREGFEVPQGTGDPMELFRYDQFYWSIPRKDAPTYRLLGIKYIVMPRGALPGGADIWPVYTDDPTVELHLNTRALPRAWLVYRTEAVASFEAARARVFAPDFDPAAVAVVQGGPRLEGEGEGRIGVAAYEPNRAVFDVEVSREALFVLSDQLYPGWEATLDGEAVPLLPTDTIFRGVVVPPGAHRIEMRYAPASFRFGVGLMLAALLCLIAAWRGGRSPR